MQRDGSQMELQMVEAGIQVPGCRECLEPVFDAKRDVPLSGFVLPNPKPHKATRKK